MTAELLYDNSKDNPNNPNKPPKRVRWGRESSDEMGSITLMVVCKDEADLPALQAAVRAHVGKSTVARVTDQIDARFAEYDTNRDGKITRDEAPKRMARFFELLDEDKNGSLDKAELKRVLEGMAGGFGGFGGGGTGNGGSGGGGK